MSLSSRETERDALAWLVRINDPDFDDWDAWQAWLTADAAHSEAYWRLAGAEADAVDLLGRRSAPGPAAGRRPTLTGAPRRAAIAAAVAALGLGGLWFAWRETPRPWVVETAPGERRALVLPDGSRVALDGATRLTMDRRAAREVTLETGRALFEVAHRDADPFRVLAGGATLTDLGTTFDVTLLRDGARVAVSDGIVRVDRAGESETLRAGEGVLATTTGLERRPAAVEDVASWREGRLSYLDESLEVIAQDLARAIGRPVSVAPTVSDRRFSGSLSTDAPPAALKARLARLLGVSIVEDGAGWRLEP